MESLDHVFVSPVILRGAVAVEHIHANTWATEKAAQSDHDPTVAKVNVCVEWKGEQEL